MNKGPTIFLIFSLIILGSCSGDFVMENGSGGADDGADTLGADASPTANLAAKQFFDSSIVPLLASARPKGACALCHQGTNVSNGPIFMGESSAENYSAMTGDVSLVGSSPTNSSLLTRGDHSGNAFCTGAGVPYSQCTQDESALISEWITMQNL